MFGVIDRIEGDIVVIEFDDESIKKINSNDIDGNFKEGDVLYFEKGLYKVNIEETKKRKKEAEDFLGLWE